MQKSTLLALIVAITPFTIDSHAALYDRGNGMIYDSVQNITWLRDMNYAKTSGYHVDGRMTWDEATAWASNLTYGGYTDWRLPSGNLICNGMCMPSSGQSDSGYWKSYGEFGHLFYSELYNKARLGRDGQPMSEYGLINAGPFINFENASYWEQELFIVDLGAWYFSMSDGYHGMTERDLHYFNATAVRDGDVSEVPAPAAAWLVGSALAGLAGAIRRK